MTLQDSLNRIMEDRDGVAAIFYEIFFECVPEAKPLFKDVNLKHQTVLLTMALMVVERHHKSGYLATALYLKYLGHKHHLRAVPEHLYAKWIDALLAALEKFHGPDWEADLASQWRAALEHATAVMLQGYREPIHV